MTPYKFRLPSDLKSPLAYSSNFAFYLISSSVKSVGVRLGCVMASRLNAPKPGDFVRTETSFSRTSSLLSSGNQSTQSTAYDSTEVVFTTEDNKISFDKKANLTGTNGQPAEGILTVDIPKWTNVVKIYLGEKSKGEASVFYATIRLPRKVLRKRLQGHYTQLYIRASRSDEPNVQASQGR